MEGPLARLEPVRVGRIETAVRAAVLVVDAGRRVDHAGAEPRVVRFDEAHRVALGVGGRQVDRPAAGRVGGGECFGRTVPVDARRKLVEPGRVEQRADDIAGERRIAHEGVAIGHRDPRRLDAQMDPLGIGDAGRAEGRRGRRLEPRQQSDQLERDHAAAVGRVARDADAAVVDGDRIARHRPVRGEVGARDECADVVEEAALPVAQVAVVVGIESVARERLEGRRERRQTDALTGSPRPSVRAEDRREPGARVAQRGRDRRGPLDRLDEPVPGREAGPGQLDGRGQDRVTRQPSPGTVGVAPGADGARDGDRERTAERELGEAARPQEGGVGP